MSTGKVTSEYKDMCFIFMMTDLLFREYLSSSSLLVSMPFGMVETNHSNVPYVTWL